MNLEEFKEKLFKKLVEKKEFVEEDIEKYNQDFEEFNPTWEIFIEVINEAVEADFPKTYSEMIAKGYRGKKKRKPRQAK